MIKNRQIRTDYNKGASEDIILIAQKDIVVNGKEYKKNEVLEMTKAEAKKILTKNKKAFEIKMD